MRVARVFLEVVNRGRDQSLAIMSGARAARPVARVVESRATASCSSRDSPWRFSAGSSTWAHPGSDLPGARRAGRGRRARKHIERSRHALALTSALSYCASDPRSAERDADVSRAKMDETPRPLPRDDLAVRRRRVLGALAHGAGIGLYEVIYQAKGSPVAGLGLAAIRDFASYLRHGAAGATLRETPAALQRVVGYGYSQSARFLREFVRDGFNADERGRAVFDGLMISSAGAGGGSFNHRFAMPGRPATPCCRSSVRSTCRRSPTTGCSPRARGAGARRRSSTPSRRPSTGRAPAR